MQSGADNWLGPWAAAQKQPIFKVSKSFPWALVDLCGLELIIDWECERSQPFLERLPW